jgi:hypothetical protein
MLVVLLVLLLVFTLKCHGLCDNHGVFSLPVTDVVLSNEKQMRGTPIFAGTPPQALSMMPQP